MRREEEGKGMRPSLGIPTSWVMVALAAYRLEEGIGLGTQASLLEKGDWKRKKGWAKALVGGILTPG